MNAWARSQAFWHKERKATVAALRKTLGDRMKGFDDQTLEEMIYIYNHDRTALTEADKVDIRNTSAWSRSALVRNGSIITAQPVNGMH
jgi:hypothetical protein